MNRTEALSKYQKQMDLEAERKKDYLFRQDLRLLLAKSKGQILRRVEL